MLMQSAILAIIAFATGAYFQIPAVVEPLSTVFSSIGLPGLIAPLPEETVITPPHYRSYLEKKSAKRRRAFRRDQPVAPADVRELKRLFPGKVKSK